MSAAFIGQRFTNVLKRKILNLRHSPSFVLTTQSRCHVYWAGPVLSHSQFCSCIRKRPGQPPAGSIRNCPRQPPTCSIRNCPGQPQPAVSEIVQDSYQPAVLETVQDSPQPAVLETFQDSP